MNQYTYNRIENGLNCRLINETNNYSRYAVDIPCAQEARHIEPGRIKGVYFVPRIKGKLPLAILVHGMGDRSVYPCRLMAHTLVKQGIACFILYLVFHSSRIASSIKRKYPRLTDEEWFESYRTSVTDIRQVIDWAESRPEIDCEKISAAGISFGGIVSSIAMGLDTRIKSGVFIVTGGNSDKIMKHSLLLRWQYRNNGENFQRDQKSYFQYLAEIEEKGFENVKAGKNSYLTDPRTFSSYVKNRPVMMINALWDEVIPRAAALDLWEAYGRPPIIWYPATHASIWLWYPHMGSRISSFLKKTLRC